jgi:hypothetical protein
MTTTINASTVSGLVQTADTSGSLALQTANTTALTLDTSQNATFAGTVTATSFSGSGANLTGVGSITSLGTITTTSGTSASSGTLNLTNYKQLLLVFNAVSTNSATATSKLFLASGPLAQITTQLAAATDNFYGSVYIDLSNGVYWANTNPVPTGAAPTGNNSAPYCGISTYTTASTVITIYTNGATFDNGSIIIYGVK